MRLTRLSIERPVLISMVFAAICLLGLLSMQKIPAELNPRVQFPTITVITIYPGASPEEVETVVTRPIEDAVYSVNNVEGVDSRSQENLSLVIVNLKMGADLDAAQASVREKVDLVRAQLPSEVRPPVVGKVDINAQPVLVLGVTGAGRTPLQLRSVVDNTIKPRLGRVPGVASVDVVGGDVREVHVTLRRADLEAQGLAMSDIVMGLQAASVSAPGGHVTQDQRDYSVRMIGEFANLDDIRKVQIPKIPDLGALGALGSAGSLPSLAAMGGGNLSSLMSGALGGGARTPARPLTVGEVATVKDAVAERDTIARVQQQESVGLFITKLGDANTVNVAEGVKAALDELRVTLPQDVRVYLAQDQSQRVLDALHDVNLALLLGVLLTVLVVYAFLHDFRGTLIVAVAIPTSISATFLPMHFLGFTLNQMTMLGLSLSVGILVDDSIVVLENIHRHLRAGAPPKEAALLGRKEIGQAALAITLVDVVVFLPIAFMGGTGGQFFRQFALTTAFATLFSLFVSFTLTPAMAAHWYRALTPDPSPASEGSERVEGKTRGRGEKEISAYESVAQSYRRVLDHALRHRFLVASVGFGALALALVVGGKYLDFGLLPTADQGQLRVRVEMPPDAALAVTERAVARAEAEVRRLPEVKSIFSNVGQVTGGFMAETEQGKHLGSLLIELQPKSNGIVGRTLVRVSAFLPDTASAMESDKNADTRTGVRPTRTRSDAAIAADLRARLTKIPGASFTVAPVRGFEGVLRPIELQLFGNDLNRLREGGEKIRDRIAKLPGILNADVSLRIGKPELQVKVDREKSASFDLMVGPAAQALRDSLEGNTDAKFRDGGEKIPIRVQYAKEDRSSPEDVRRIIVGRSNKRPVYIEDIAQITQGAGATDIARKNRRRLATVTADLAPGYSAVETQERIERELSNLPLAGLDRQWGGEVEQIAENMLPWLYAMALSVVLVYMLLASLYNSLLQPFVVLSGLPMALVGAIFALLLSGEALTMVAIIGLIMLIGIVGKNGILLVDFTNTLRGRGLARTEAIIEAGATRLRPILMTTFTIVFGMLPIALRFGRGSEIRAPMAITVIGGLLLSTALTLVMVPVLYSYVDDMSGLLFGRRGGESSVSQ